MNLLRGLILILPMMCAADALSCCKTDPPIVEKKSPRKLLLPDFFPVQYAGNIGIISAGIGYISRRGEYQLGLMYSYTPASVSEVRIHTIAAKNAFHIAEIAIDTKSSVLAYAGVALSAEIAGNSFLVQPAVMPKGYYDFPKSLRLIPSAGVKLRRGTSLGPFERVEMFAESTTTDLQIWYKATSDQVRLRDILSLAIGFNLIR